MSNKRRITVDEAFITLIKNKLVNDQRTLPLANVSDKIAHRINLFIRENLESYDKNLHARAVRWSGGEYPSPKTVERAFYTDRLATIELLDICGWYIFEDQWTMERKQFPFKQQQESTNVKNNFLEASELEAESDIKVDVDQETGSNSTKLHKIKAGGKININISQK